MFFQLLQAERPIETTWVWKHPGVCSCERFVLPAPVALALATDGCECSLAQKGKISRRELAYLSFQFRRCGNIVVEHELVCAPCRPRNCGCDAAAISQQLS